MVQKALALAVGRDTHSGKTGEGVGGRGGGWVGERGGGWIGG
jgi:hypothetical protein